MNLGPQQTAPVSVTGGSLRKYGVCFAILTLLALSLAQLQAAQLDIQLMDDSSTLGHWTPTLISAGDNTWKVSNVTNNVGAATISWYNVSVDTDPFMSASVDVVNNTLVAQNYTLIFTTPVFPPLVGATLMGGSTQGGVTDASNNGIGTVSTLPGKPLYFGQIDGVDVLPIFPDLTTINAPFAGGSSSIAANVGLPGPTIPSGPVATSIGIKHQFSLTAGDRATFTSFFIVVPVPEPSALGLLAIGGLMLFRRRSR